MKKLVVFLICLTSINLYSEISSKITKKDEFGNTIERTFFDNKKQIAVIKFDEKGIVIKITGNVPDNIVVKSYFNSGKLQSESIYKNNKLNGLRKKYYESGELQSKSFFKNDLLDGISETYYKSGKIRSETNYLNDSYVREKRYFENGNLKMLIPFKNGFIDGIVKIYFENGMINQEETWINGKQQNIVIYNEKGEILNYDKTKNPLKNVEISFLDSINQNTYYADEFGQLIDTQAKNIIGKKVQIEGEIKSFGRSSLNNIDGNSSLIISFINDIDCYFNKEDKSLFYCMTGSKVSIQGDIKGTDQNNHIVLSNCELIKDYDNESGKNNDYIKDTSSFKKIILENTKESFSKYDGKQIILLGYITKISSENTIELDFSDSFPLSVELFKKLSSYDKDIKVGSFVAIKGTCRFDGKRFLYINESEIMQVDKLINLNKNNDKETLKTSILWMQKTFQIINSITFSPNGELIASGEWEGIEIWSVSTGKLLKTLKTLDYQKDYIYSLSFSPDGKLLASGSMNNINLWDVNSGKLINSYEGSSATSINFSPDGKIIAVGCVSGEIKLINVKTSDIIKIYESESSFISSISFSPGSKTIAFSGDFDNVIRLLDVNTGSIIREFKGHTDLIKSISFNPDGKIIVSASKDKSIKLWDAQSGDLIKTINGQSEDHNSVAFSNDGKLIASIGDYHNVNLWNKETGNFIGELLKYDFDSATTIAFSPTAKTIVVGSLAGTLNLISYDIEK